MIKLYPEVPSNDESKFGKQTFDAGYVPVELDSEQAAVNRMLVAIDDGMDKEAVKAKGLNRADEVATVDRLFDEIISEGSELEKCGVDADAIRARAKHLDAERWIVAAEAVEAAKPVVEVMAEPEPEPEPEDDEPAPIEFTPEEEEIIDDLAAAMEADAEDDPVEEVDVVDEEIEADDKIDLP